MRTPSWSNRPRPASSRWLVGGALGIVMVVAAACSSGGTTSATSTTVASGSSNTSSSNTSSGPAVVTVASVGSLGQALVNSSGRTLYHFTLDTNGKSACTGTCASLWTPVTVPAGTTQVVAGSGVGNSNLGTITRSDGSLQVTFKGMPLYTYTGDTKAGMASGQGVGGTWFIVTTSAQAAGAGTSSSTTTTTKSSGGYGY